MTEFKRQINTTLIKVEDIMTDKYCGDCKHNGPDKLCIHPDIKSKATKPDQKLHLLATGQPKYCEPCLVMRKPKGLCGLEAKLYNA